MYLIPNLLVLRPMRHLTLIIPLAFLWDFGGNLALRCVEPLFG